MITRNSSPTAGVRLLAPILMLAASGALAAGQVGETAAAFDLENLEGGFLALDDYRDTAVVFLQVIGYG